MSMFTIKTRGVKKTVAARKPSSGTNLTTINVAKPKKVAAKVARKPTTKTGGPNSMVKRKSPKTTRKLCNRSKTV